MATPWQRIVTLILIFLLGIVAGSGLGFLYGKNAASTELQQELTEVQNRFDTVNQNYLILVREYNKLFRLSGTTVQPVATVPAVESETYQVPASGEEKAEAEAEITPATPEPETAEVEESTEITETEKPEEATDIEVPAETTEAEESPETAESEETSEATAELTEAEESTAAEEEEVSDVPAPEAEFEAESIGGTGPLEGPPPQPFRFSDLSTGEIESWEWEFGDGDTSTEKDPEHTYRQCPNDLCTVKLTVCGSGGCDTEVKEDYLWVSEGCSGC